MLVLLVGRLIFLSDLLIRKKFGAEKDWEFKVFTMGRVEFQSFERSPNLKHRRQIQFVSFFGKKKRRRH